MYSITPIPKAQGTSLKRWPKDFKSQRPMDLALYVPKIVLSCFKNLKIIISFLRMCHP